MKIERVAMEGIASYRERVEIDLTREPFSTAGIFVISGPTGAGKSTILDAITLALYHKTPRLDGKEDRHPSNIINLGADEGRVEVDFSIGGERYRAAFVLRRGKRINRASLVRLSDGKVLADKPKEVEREVARIVGMDFESFRRCVILPQGEFAAFLKAKPDRKREILEATVGMDIYERLKERYNERKNRLEGEISSSRAAYEELRKMEGSESPGDVERRLEEVRGEMEALEGRIRALRAHLEGIRRLHKLTEELKEVERGEEELKGREEEMKALERRVRAVERSMVLAGPYQILKARREELAEKRKALERARAHMREREEELERFLVEWKRVEESLERESEDLERALTRVRWLSGLIKDLERYRSLRETLKGVDGRARELEEALRARREKMEGIREALRRMYRRHHSHLRALQRALEEAKERHGALRESLERARREHLAGELRRGLKDGDRCPVCGGEFREKSAPRQAASVELSRLEEELKGAEEELEKLKEEHRRAESTLDLFPEELRAPGEGEGEEAPRAKVLEMLRELDALVAFLKEAERELERTSRERAEAEEELGEVQRALKEKGAEEIPGLLREVEGLPGRLERLERRREEIREEMEKLKERRRRKEEDVGRLRREVEMGEGELEKLKGVVEGMEKDFRRRLEELGYSSEEEFMEVFRDAERLEEMRRRVAEHRQMEAHLRKRREEIERELDGRRVDGGELKRSEMEVEEEERRLKELKEEEGRLKERHRELLKRKRAIEEAREKLKALEREMELLQRLGSVLERNRLRDYALEMVLTYLLETANQYLESLTEGRYLFSAEEGRILSSLKIVDMWSGGEMRPVETLSGGEQFLASLSLALALSDLSSMRGEVGSLFLDEGFGTLDARSLEMVLDALERLKLEGRMIGVISHLDEVKRRIPVKILVRKSSGGSSVRVHPSPGDSALREMAGTF